MATTVVAQDQPDDAALLRLRDVLQRVLRIYLITYAIALARSHLFQKMYVLVDWDSVVSICKMWKLLNKKVG
jgi:hypothetical protein